MNPTLSPLAQRTFWGSAHGTPVRLLFLWIGWIFVAGADVVPADRRILWSPGIPGGIPERGDIWCDVTQSIPGYTGALANPADDGVDDWGPLNHAITNCPDGKVVSIPPGTYKITGELAVRKSITVRGAGMGRTIIKVEAKFDSQAFFIQAARPFLLSPQFSIASGTDKDSTKITYDQPIGGSGNPFIAVGLPLVIMHENPPELVAINGCTWCGNNYSSYTQAQIVVPTHIVARNSAGKGEVTFTPPLYMSLKNAPKSLGFSGVVSFAGIEDLTIDHVRYYNGGSASVAFQNARHCWAKDVEIKKSPKSGFKLLSSFGCEVRGSYVHDAWNTAGGSAYGFHIFGFNSSHLIENNVGENLRHTFVLEGGGNGCVIGYNYSRGAQTETSPGWVHNDIVTHGAHPYLNLYEGNFAHKWSEDWVHGSASHNTAFRNHLTAGLEPDDYGGGYEDKNGVRRSYSNAFWAVSAETYNYFMSAAGNVLGWPGMGGRAFDYEYKNSAPAYGSSIYKLGYGSEGATTVSDPKSAETFHRHGNFDFVTNETKWQSGNSDRTIPSSLYLTAKPTWFGAVRFPPIGPDQTPMYVKLPAQLRLEQIKRGEYPGRPSAPKNVRILP